MSKAKTAADCPNCYTDDDAETDCPHLLAGDECPECGAEMEKPPAGKVQCPRCKYVVNGQYMFHELRDFEVTARQGKRLLDLFGYTHGGTPGSVENNLWSVCNDLGIDPEDLNDVLADLRRVGDFAPAQKEEMGGPDE
jgi:hypothetical protein